MAFRCLLLCLLLGEDVRVKCLLDLGHLLKQALYCLDGFVLCRFGFAREKLVIYGGKVVGLVQLK